MSLAIGADSTIAKQRSQEGENERSWYGVAFFFTTNRKAFSTLTLNQSARVAADSRSGEPGTRAEFDLPLQDSRVNPRSGMCDSQSLGTFGVAGSRLGIVDVNLDGNLIPGGSDNLARTATLRGCDASWETPATIAVFLSHRWGTTGPVAAMSSG